MRFSSESDERLLQINCKPKALLTLSQSIHSHFITKEARRNRPGTLVMRERERVILQHWALCLNHKGKKAETPVTLDSFLHRMSCNFNVHNIALFTLPG